jgi:hypothetical protein
MFAHAVHGKILWESYDVPYIDKDVSILKATFKHEKNHHDMQDMLAFFDQIKTEDKDFYPN